MKRGNTYSVRYNYKDHAGKPCKGWETFKTKAEAQERKITVEKELLDAINATGFGPQGFGGATTCLGVAIEQKPTHVACLPVAVNISCHVTRRASRTL